MSSPPPLPPVGESLMDAARETLGAVVGPEFVHPPGPDDVVAGRKPLVVVEPADEKELAQVLHLSNEMLLKVAPRGGGTKLGWGNAPSELDVILSTRRLEHIVEHAWADMTVIVEAGVTVARLQQTLAQHGQRIATDPLWPERATIGGILSTNDSGTLRLRFGALRDLIIGVTLALPDGTLAKSGGKVVKNVAGYDLPKLATGALGTLGVITQAAFRLHPVPYQTRTLSFRATSFADANRLILSAQDSPLVHTGLQARISHDSAPAVDVRFEGTAAGIEAQCATLRKLAANAVETEEAAEVWGARQELWAQAATAALVKFSVLPSRIDAACEQFRRQGDANGVNWKMVVQGTGLGWARLDSLPMPAYDPSHVGVPRPPAGRYRGAVAALRTELERDGGSLFLAHPPDLPVIDAWGSPGDSFPLMVRVKQQFDPRGTLNPGRFVGGI